MNVNFSFWSSGLEGIEIGETYYECELFFLILRPRRYWNWREIAWSFFCITFVELLLTKSMFFKLIFCFTRFSCYLWIEYFFLFQITIRLTSQLLANTRMQIGDYGLFLRRCSGTIECKACPTLSVCNSSHGFLCLFCFLFLCF